MDIPENVEVDDEGLEYTASGGVYSDSWISRYNCLMLDANVTADIESLEVESANDVCEIINDDNIDTYRDIDDYVDSVYAGNNKSSYKEGDVLSAEYTYAFDDSLINDNANLVASFIVKIKLADGTEHWDFEYQPSVVSEQYLMTNILHQELGD
jgi:hypothetical protein